MNHAPSARDPAELARARSLCESKLAAGDLSLYYSLLFTPPPQRAAATALYAFWLEVREVNAECSDPQVGRVKLAWWQEEVEAVFAGKPRHPITVALAPVVASHGLAPQPFYAFIEALGQHIGTTEYATFACLREHARNTRGRLERLAAAFADGAAPIGEERACELGATLELVALVRDVGVDARRGRIYLPHEELARLGVAAEDLRSGRATETLRRLIALSAERLLDELARDTAALSMRERRGLLPLVIAGAIARRLLAKIRSRAERVLRERVRVPAPQQLWIAWRTARSTS